AALSTELPGRSRAILSPPYIMADRSIGLALEFSETFSPAGAAGRAGLWTDAIVGLGRRQRSVRADADGDRRAHAAHGRGEKWRSRDRPRLGRRTHQHRGG